MEQFHDELHSAHEMARTIARLAPTPKDVTMDVLREAAQWALLHFEAMDRGNAAMHCAPVRYSPITFRLAKALRDTWPSTEDITEEMARVLHHEGMYKEDPGR